MLATFPHHATQHGDRRLRTAAVCPHETQLPSHKFPWKLILRMFRTTCKQIQNFSNQTKVTTLCTKTDARFYHFGTNVARVAYIPGVARPLILLRLLAGYRKATDRSTCSAWLQASLSWNVTQRWLVFSDQRFGATYCPHLQGSRDLTLEDGTVFTLEGIWPLTTGTTGWPTVDN
jgi:hypothetical protein